MTDRRTFIGTLAGGLVPWPFATFTQQPAKLPRIGILGNEVGGPPWEAFRQGMRDLGYKCANRMNTRESSIGGLMTYGTKLTDNCLHADEVIR